MVCVCVWVGGCEWGEDGWVRMGGRSVLFFLRGKRRVRNILTQDDVLTRLNMNIWQSQIGLCLHTKESKIKLTDTSTDYAPIIHHL